MGFDHVNNTFRNGLFMNYDIYDPFWKVLDMHNELSIELNQLYAPRKYTSLEIEYEFRTTFRNRLTVGIDINAFPFEIHDYNEPRVDGWMVVYPSRYDFRFFLSPDYTKTFVVDFSAGTSQSTSYDMRGYDVRLAPRLRISDNLFIRLSSSLNYDHNNLGYVTDSLRADNTEAIIFGLRDIKNLTNTLNFDYTFSSKTNLQLRLRHYWFVVDYEEFYDLLPDGYLQANDFQENYDLDYSAFNIDMYFTWYFAPGSEIVLAWKNAISHSQDLATQNFFKSFEQTISSPATNSFSLKILYYLDYQYLKRKNKRTD
jgi:hypothetical protein